MLRKLPTWTELNKLIFFQNRYVKMAADKGFHVDGWEEVWEYEDPEKPGLWKIYDPAVWNVDK